MSFEKCIKKVKGMEVVMAVEVMVVVVFATTVYSLPRICPRNLMTFRIFKVLLLCNRGENEKQE